MVTVARQVDWLDGDRRFPSGVRLPNIVKVVSRPLGRALREIAVLRGHEDAENSAAFSADGSRIVTASYKTARIWTRISQNNARGGSVPSSSRDEIRLAGWPDGTLRIDPCARIE
jgi:WD40 repeat protein